MDQTWNNDVSGLITSSRRRRLFHNLKYFVHYLGHEGTGDLIDLTRLSEKYKGEVNFPEDRFQILLFQWVSHLYLGD